VLDQLGRVSAAGRLARGGPVVAHPSRRAKKRAPQDEDGASGAQLDPHGEERDARLEP
jgi:hypothetical protein